MKRTAGMLLSLTSVLVVLAIGFPSKGFSGGELGHGRTKTFTSKLMALEVRYPETWTHFDLSSSVSFTDRSSETTAATSNELLITTEDMPAAQTAQALFVMVQTLHPELLWNMDGIEGRAAFRANRDEKGILYVLQSPGKVLSIRYRSVNQEAAEREICKILDSIRLSSN